MLKQYVIILVSILIFFASVKIARNFVDDKPQCFEPITIMGKNKYLYDLSLQGDLMLRMKCVTLNGFHDPEHFGRWTSEPRSVVGNIHPPIIKGKIINICGSAFTPNIGVTGVLNIGNSKYDIEFLSKESCHNFLYSGNRVVNKVVIEGFNTISPKEIGMNNDMRKLGLAIKSIEIK